jgi:alginate O-acetyltransferase complex protein AlgI
MSLLFYAWWNPAYLWLLVASVFCNYCVVLLLQRQRNIFVLCIGIALNIGLLSYFKYMDFFLDSFNHVLEIPVPLLELLLPLAISFFTFQQIAYLVDTYRGETKQHRFMEYCLFVTFFPQLIAGPIVRHSEFFPQILSKKFGHIHQTSIALGLSMIIIGLFKKEVLADTFGLMADPAFSIATGGGIPMFGKAWIATLAYPFQIYFDFSGYTDMALGSAYMFGIRLPDNFKAPYKAKNIREFWQRWHCTLSLFLRDYLYIPLGGNRKGALRQGINIMITMLLGGLWHGAAWGFVLWGGAHGLLLIGHHAFKKVAPIRFPIWLSMGTTFTLVALLWMPFRAGTLGSGRRMFQSLAGVNGISAEGFTAYQIIILALGLFVVWAMPTTAQLLQLEDTPSKYKEWLWKPTFFWGMYVGVLALAGIALLSDTKAFIYFQF